MRRPNRVVAAVAVAGLCGLSSCGDRTDVDHSALTQETSTTVDGGLGRTVRDSVLSGAPTQVVIDVYAADDVRACLTDGLGLSSPPTCLVDELTTTERETYQPRLSGDPVPLMIDEAAPTRRFVAEIVVEPQAGDLRLVSYRILNNDDLRERSK